MFVTLFDAAGVAMIGWLLMILLPGWRVTRALVRHQLFPLATSLLYLVGVVALLADTGAGVVRDFGSAEGVIGILADPRIALVVWIHILAFDHLVAVLIFRDNLAAGIVPLPLQSAILVATLMFGPIGFLVYCGARAVRGLAPAPPLAGAAG